MSKTQSQQGLVRVSQSPEGTLALGVDIGKCLIGGLTIGLVGPLGAGKTQLIKGIAVGNGLNDERQVTSPTFTLVQEYPGRFTLFHLDVYRLSKPGEFAGLGVMEMIRPDSVVLVEWADRVADELPGDSLWATLEVTGDAQRRLSLRAGGPFSADQLDRLRQRLG